MFLPAQVAASTSSLCATADFSAIGDACTASLTGGSFSGSTPRRRASESSPSCIGFASRCWRGSDAAGRRLAVGVCEGNSAVAFASRRDLAARCSPEPFEICDEASRPSTAGEVLAGSTPKRLDSVICSASARLGDSSAPDVETCGRAEAGL